MSMVQKLNEDQVKAVAAALEKWNAVWVGLQIEGMSAKESELFINLSFADKGRLSDVISDDRAPFSIKLLVKRLQVLQLKVSAPVVIMLSLLSASPGEAVMYCHGIKAYTKKHNLESFDLDDFVQMYPNGYPTKNELSLAWDAQKVGEHDLAGYKGSVDNLLDLALALGL